MYGHGGIVGDTAVALNADAPVYGVATPSLTLPLEARGSGSCTPGGATGAGPSCRRPLDHSRAMYARESGRSPAELRPT